MLVQLYNPATDTVISISAPEDWKVFKETPIWGGVIRFRETYIRIPQNAERDFTLGQLPLRDGWELQIGRTTNSREAILNPIRRTFLLIGSLTLVLGFVAGSFVANRAMQPVRQIVSTARSIIRTGQMDARVPVRQSDDGTGRTGAVVQQPFGQESGAHPRHA